MGADANEVLRLASRALGRAGTEAERLAALERQLRAVLALTQPAPLSLDEVPPWLWDAAMTRAAIAQELASPGEFTAWRLGWWARYLPREERASVFERALDSFEALIPTPVGPGNDDGPFCDFASELSLEQTRRALGIVARMSAARWGSEAVAARHALALRLVALGHHAEAAPLLSDAEPALTPRPPSRASADREWNESLRESAESGAVLRFLTSARASRLLHELAGQPGVDLCREVLVTLPGSSGRRP